MTPRLNKALLLGCGNIGAGYDLGDETRVWTHAKAMSILGMDVHVYDINPALASQVAETYKFTLVEEVPDLRDFSLVCIATPTSTHYDLLKNALESDVPLVICEKPVALQAAQLKALQEQKKISRSKVLVNFIRRFQPAFNELRQHIAAGIYGDLCAARITYGRGFMNNGSHALDLVEYLFGQPIQLSAFHKLSFSNDVFNDDPTLTGEFLYKSAPVQVLGLAYAEFRLFELHLYFTGGMLEIISGGDIVRYLKAQDSGILSLDKSMEGNLQRYMLPVYDHALSLVENPDVADNFTDAVRLNLEMLTVINK